MTDRNVIKPQLARKCYTVDTSDDDDDDGVSESSLEILSPVKKQAAAATGSPPSSSAPAISSWKNYPCKEETNVTEKPSHVARLSSQLSSSDSESSSDELLNQYTKPTFARKNSTHTTSRNATSRVASSAPSLPSSRDPFTSTSTTASFTTAARKRQRTTASSSSSSSRHNTVSHEDREDAKARREAERARKKLEAERLKRQTKLARQIQQRDKQLQKEADKAARKHQRTETQQAAGRFAKNEIVVLLDPFLYRTNEYGLVTRLEEEEYMVKEFATHSMYKKAIQWVRQEHLKGGAEQAWKSLTEKDAAGRSQVHHIPNLVLLMDYQDYIPLIQRIEHDVDDDFPKLECWLTGVQRQWRQEWQTGPREEPRITLILNQVAEELDKKWNSKRGRTNDNEVSLPSDWEFRDSLQWLLVQFRVDSISCTSTEEVTSTLLKFTRGVSEAPYIGQTTELECVRKIKPAPNVSQDDMYSKAHDTWFRQLQMIPMVSEARARNLVEHYPTLWSLWQAYQDCEDEATKALLLSECFGARSSQSQLSTTIYRVLTSNDPNEMV